MTDDIVTRLRLEAAEWQASVAAWRLGRVDIHLPILEAADEIERLRAACAMAQDFIDHHINCATILRLRDCNCGFDEVWKALEARRG